MKTILTVLIFAVSVSICKASVQIGCSARHPISVDINRFKGSTPDKYSELFKIDKAPEVYQTINYIDKGSTLYVEAEKIIANPVLGNSIYIGPFVFILKEEKDNNNTKKVWKIMRVDDKLGKYVPYKPSEDQNSIRVSTSKNQNQENTFVKREEGGQLVIRRGNADSNWTPEIRINIESDKVVIRDVKSDTNSAPLATISFTNKIGNELTKVEFNNQRLKIDLDKKFKAAEWKCLKEEPRTSYPSPNPNGLGTIRVR